MEAYTRYVPKTSGGKNETAATVAGTFIRLFQLAGPVKEMDKKKLQRKKTIIQNPENCHCKRGGEGHHEFFSFSKTMTLVGNS